MPSLVALIAENYRGAQQATAVGSLGSARAASGVSAFLIGGALGTWVGWRPVFGILAGLAVVVFLLSFRLRSDSADPSVKIDLAGAALIGAAIVALTLGFNNLNGWGLLWASDDAPFAVAEVSPAPLLIVLGVILGQGFFVWTRRRAKGGRTALLSLEVVGSAPERAAVYALFVIVALEAALNFTVPLYIQIVQGRSPFDTSLAMMPFNLTVFVAALLVVRFYDRYPSRTIARFGFGLSAVALLWLAFVVTNDWETLPTILGLVVFGIGQGALVTLLFNVLVTSSPPRLAGDVGSLRGTTQNLASAVGTAVAGALLVTLLTTSVLSAVADSGIPESLRAQVPLDAVNFVSNDDLAALLAQTDATPAQKGEALAINVDARLESLRAGLLVMAALAALAIVPAGRLPGRQHAEIPDPSPPGGSA